MKVSIIIPIYNVERYIFDCLQSVMHQSMTENVECILVDDCGQDKSMQIAEQMVTNYHGNIQFSILHHKQNKGLSGARNSGMRVAKGKYLYFLDSDDTIISDCIESMWKMAEKYPNVNCVFAGANVIEGHYSWMDYTKKSLPEFSDNREWIQESMLSRYDFSMTAWNRLISRQFINENNLFFEEGFIHEDELWNLAISQTILSAAFLKKNTYNYFIRANSITAASAKDIQLFLNRKFRIYNRMLDNINGYRKGIQSYYIILFARECLKYIYTLKDYSKMMNMAIRATCKADSMHAIKITRIVLGWNKQLISKAICHNH